MFAVTYFILINLVDTYEPKCQKRFQSVAALNFNYNSGTFFLHGFQCSFVVDQFETCSTDPCTLTNGTVATCTTLSDEVCDGISQCMTGL